MRIKIPRRSEPFPANLTNVRLFPGMRPRVHRQMNIFTERFPAHRTHERLLARMLSHVNAQEPRMHKRHAAMVTNVALLLTVRAHHMRGQVASRRERFAAFTANIRTLTCNNSSKQSPLKN